MSNLICECGNAHFTIEFFEQKHTDCGISKPYSWATCTRCKKGYQT